MECPKTDKLIDLTSQSDHYWDIELSLTEEKANSNCSGLILEFVLPLGDLGIFASPLLVANKKAVKRCLEKAIAGDLCFCWKNGGFLVDCNTTLG